MKKLLKALITVSTVLFSLQPAQALKIMGLADSTKIEELGFWDFFANLSAFSIDNGTIAFSMIS